MTWLARHRLGSGPMKSLLMSFADDGVSIGQTRRTVYEPPLRLYEAEPASTMVAVLLPLIYHELIDGPAFQPWVQK